jgi:hypothetical protein
MTQCECPVSGHCQRHKIEKNKHWHHLCQTHEGYFRLWEKGTGPGQYSPPKPTRLTPVINGAAAWKALHTYPVENAETWDETQAKKWYRQWLKQVPSYGCSCKSNWKQYTKEYPPPLLAAKSFFEWTVVAHNYVSTTHAEPRKEAITLRQAAEMYSAPWHEETIPDLQ